MRYHGQYVAYQPIPEPPMWHPPQAEEIVTYRPYARKKDMTMGMGSFALAPIMFGVDAPVAAPMAMPVASPAAEKPSARAAAAVKKFFKKDETGKSKAQQVAERAVAKVTARQQPQPPPEPIVVQAPPPTDMAKSEMAQAGMMIALSLGIGLGVGYIMGRRA
jgi:hypothetical protein